MSRIHPAVRAVVAHALAAAVMVAVAVPAALWLLMTADEIAQENSRAGPDGAQLGAGFALLTGGPAVLALVAAVVAAVLLVRRSRVPAWRATAVASVVTALAVLHALWRASDGGAVEPGVAGQARAAAIAVALAGALASAVMATRTPGPTAPTPPGPAGP